MTLPDILSIEPIHRPVRAIVRVPGSKSITNRVLPVAALAQGASRLLNALECDDTQVMIESLRRLGIPIEHDPMERTVRIRGCGGKLPARQADLFLGNSGTSIRFLTAIVSLGHGVYRLDGVPRMRERPIGDLLTALTALGVDARSERDNGCPPVIVRGKGLGGGTVVIRGDTSSQFASALLLAAPLAADPVTIRLAGPLVSKPYIDMTLAVVESFGVSCDRTSGDELRFSGQCHYQGRTFAIEPDASSASYFFGLAAITGGTVTVAGLGSSSRQGDMSFVRYLETMGCQIVMQSNSTTVTGGPLLGMDADLSDASDLVPTLAAVACFASSPTRLHNVGHIRGKESDRLSALATELRKVGAGIEEEENGLVIRPAAMHGAVLDTYDDHRMAMSLALIGLRVPGISIRNPSCTAKTYPEYFRDLAAACGRD